MSKGTFHTMRIQQSKTVEDAHALKIFGVQIAKFLPDGWVHRQSLTPSRNLLFQAKDLEKKGEWNEVAFKEFYLPHFLKGIQGNIKSKEELQEIALALNSGKDVYYACYCKHHHLCHRSIVADILERNDYNVIRN